MGETFARQLRVYERTKIKVRNHYRADGSLECQEQRILRRQQGTRALVFMKVWYHPHGLPKRQQESELLEADDYYITRRTYTFDVFGNAADGNVERITLSRPKLRALPTEHMFDTPDTALRKLLERKIAKQGALPPPSDAEPTDEREPRIKATATLTTASASIKKRKGG